MNLDAAFEAGRASWPNLNLSFDPNGKMDNPRFGYADTKFGHRTVQLLVKSAF